eukprot:scaffold30771_cov112-Isochrysis_galbana.AAC.3
MGGKSQFMPTGKHSLITPQGRVRGRACASLPAALLKAQPGRGIRTSRPTPKRTERHASDRTCRAARTRLRLAPPGAPTLSPEQALGAALCWERQWPRPARLSPRLEEQRASPGRFPHLIRPRGGGEGAEQTPADRTLEPARRSERHVRVGWSKARLAVAVGDHAEQPLATHGRQGLSRRARNSLLERQSPQQGADGRPAIRGEEGVGTRVGAELAGRQQSRACELGVLCCRVHVVHLEKAGRLLLEEHLLSRGARVLVLRLLQPHKQLLGVLPPAVRIERDAELEQRAAAQRRLVRAPFPHGLQLGDGGSAVAGSHQPACLRARSRDVLRVLLLQLEV